MACYKTQANIYNSVFMKSLLFGCQFRNEPIKLKERKGPQLDSEVSRCQNFHCTLRVQRQKMIFLIYLCCLNLTLVLKFSIFYKYNAIIILLPIYLLVKYNLGSENSLRQINYVKFQITKDSISIVLFCCLQKKL